MFLLLIKISVSGKYLSKVDYNSDLLFRFVRVVEAAIKTAAGKTRAG